MAGVAGWNGPEQELIHQAEDGRIDTDAERQGSYRNRGEPGMIAPGTEGVSQVAGQYRHATCFSALRLTGQCRTGRAVWRDTNTTDRKAMDSPTDSFVPGNLAYSSTIDYRQRVRYSRDLPTCPYCSVAPEDAWVCTEFVVALPHPDRKSTRLNSNHLVISYAVFCL